MHRPQAQYFFSHTSMIACNTIPTYLRQWQLHSTLDTLAWDACGYIYFKRFMTSEIMFCVLNSPCFSIFI